MCPNQIQPRNHAVKLSHDILEMAESIDEVVSSVAGEYGYTQLKAEQKSVIVSFVKGKYVFGSLPTGFGKSICYMLLPMIFDVLKTKFISQY